MALSSILIHSKPIVLKTFGEINPFCFKRLQEVGKHGQQLDHLFLPGQNGKMVIRMLLTIREKLFIHCLFELLQTLYLMR